MTQNHYNQRASLHEWQVEHLRLTAFPDSTMKIPVINWWEKLTGQQPESRTFRPKSDELLEEGAFETGVLALHIQPFRIDWRLTRANPKGIPDEEIPMIGEFPMVLESFLNLMQKWLQDESPQLGRLAFGAVLFLPVENHQAGYERLSAYLPNIKLDSEASSDFLYQINRPRNSNIDIPGLRVNRLSKWSIFSFVRTLMESNIRTSRSEQLSHPGAFACRLELDINTTADFNNMLPREKLLTIFKELIEFGKEIIERGDVP